MRTRFMMTGWFGNVEMLLECFSLHVISGNEVLLVLEDIKSQRGHVLHSQMVN